MRYREKPLLRRPRRRVVPLLSIRTVQNPSFLPVHISTGLPLCLQGGHQTEALHADPTMTGCGARIQNPVAGIRVLRCSQLNTPQPIMSACLFRPDPFRSGPHPIRDLGSHTWRIQNSDSQVKSGRAVVQLTQEEDQVVTNLLKLHYQDGPQVTQNIPAAGTDLSGPAEPRPESSTTDWSEIEFEVAQILLNGFS